MIRALVVDDSAFMRQAIKRMLESDPGIKVVGVACDGRQGVDLAQSLKPDVITMDVEMPEMDGLTALKLIMRQGPTHVIMISSLTTKGSEAALTAMKFGAVDVFAKDSSHISTQITTIQNELIACVRALDESKRSRNALERVGGARTVSHAPRLTAGQFDLVCIGSSTGGPPVLEQILTACPGDLPMPIVVAQHMPQTFTESMANRLDRLSRLRVVHGENRMPLEGGAVYIAPGGHHTHIKRTPGRVVTLHVDDEPADALFKPSVDVLLSTAASAMRGRTLGIVLTGMGHDGAEGAKALTSAGGTVLTQNEVTCVVYGMPKAVDEAGVSKASLPPARLIDAICSLSPSRVAA